VVRALRTDGQTDCEFHCTETNQVFLVSCSNCDAMLSIAVIRYMNQSRALCGQYLLPVWSEFACVSWCSVCSRDHQVSYQPSTDCWHFIHSKQILYMNHWRI